MSLSVTENACRVCLVEQEIMINLFDTVEDFHRQRLSDLLENCSVLKVDRTDNQPKLICDECTGELLVAAKFYEKCKRTLEILSQVRQAVEEDKLIESETISEAVVDDATEVTHSVDDTDSLIIEDHKFKDEDVESDQNSPEQLDEELMFEEVNYVEEEINNEPIILFEPEGMEEDSSPRSAEDQHRTAQDEVEHEQNIYESPSIRERKKYLRKTVAARPLIINCTCDACGAGFTHVNNLSRHIQTHNPEDVFKCSICKYPFTTYMAFEKHCAEHRKGKDLLTVKDVGEVICDIRNELLLETENQEDGRSVFVVDNENFVNEEPKKSKICDTCNKHFISKSALEAHIRTHTGDRPYKCDLCPKAFKTQGGLALHLKRHTGARPYTCNVCNKGFGESSNLRVHMRTHTGEKPHKCTICNRSFARVFLLQIHLRTHTGERPYQCPYCDKAFAQGGDLASHKRTHTGERPHVCPYCKKGFIKSSGLTQHMRKHINNETKSNESSYKTLESKENTGRNNYGLLIADEEDDEDTKIVSEDETNDVDLKVEDYVIEFPQDIET